jgi:Group 4 capsule polysaccharide lipoprotein gfcB, YjbF
VALQSTFRLKDVQPVTIEGKTYRLQEVRETVSSAGKARFENRYWVDPTTGRCWKSSQIAIPTFPALNTEILKYPVRA